MQHEFYEADWSGHGLEVQGSDLRERELAELEETMRKVLRDRIVLEVTCGSGYWTRQAMHVVKRMTSTDIKHIEALPANPNTNRREAYDLKAVPGIFNAGLANFWMSHVTPQRRKDFLQAFHRRIGYGATVFMADRIHTEGMGGELINKIAAPYYFEDQLLDLFGEYAKELHLHMGETFWYVYYEAIPCAGRRV